jgi:Fur family ferric uptake transcriptional regulator
MNISTVYRTLDLLEELGAIAKTDFGKGEMFYHIPGEEHHHHLVCRKCGQEIKIDESVLNPLKEILLRDYNFHADLKHLAFFGLCDSCFEKEVSK